jgi:hypothetical protein
LVHRLVEVNPADAAEFTSVATYLPVRKWQYVIPFLRLSFRIEQQLRRTDGIVRYGLRTNLFRKKFWTYSVWKDPKAIPPFVAAEPHATAVRKFSEWAAEGAAFSQWQNDDGKVDWEEAERRLKNPTYYYKQ